MEGLIDEYINGKLYPCLAAACVDRAFADLITCNVIGLDTEMTGGSIAARCLRWRLQMAAA